MTIKILSMIIMSEYKLKFIINSQSGFRLKHIAFCLTNPSYFTSIDSILGLNTLFTDIVLKDELHQQTFKV